MKLIRMDIPSAPNVTGSGVVGEKLLTFFSIGALAAVLLSTRGGAIGTPLVPQELHAQHL